MDRLEILSLGVMQNSLRSITPIQSSDPICIAQFEDGKRYIRDGHHRCAHAFLAGKTHLEPGEYVIEDYTYDIWTHPSIENKFYTPHDPRTEIRIADFKHHNDAVTRIITIDGQDAALEYILTHRDNYCLQRTCHLTIYDVIIESGLVALRSRL